jgi:hypothetical protein
LQFDAALGGEAGGRQRGGMLRGDPSWQAFDDFDEVGVDFQNSLGESVADFLPLVEGVAEGLADAAGEALTDEVQHGQRDFGWVCKSQPQFSEI